MAPINSTLGMSGLSGSALRYDKGSHLPSPSMMGNGPLSIHRSKNGPITFDKWVDISGRKAPISSVYLPFS
jgi:hypothetical protein